MAESLELLAKGVEMKTFFAEGLREKLLRFPPSVRRNYTLRGRPVYSRKLGRRFYVYLDSGYGMWLELEFDPSVVAFNMEPPPITFGQDKDSEGIAMAAVSIDGANRLTLHFSQDTIDQSAKGSIFEQMEASQEIKALGASIKIWSDLDDLDRLDRVNKHTLLRYLCAPQVVVDAAIEKEILDTFKWSEQFAFGTCSTNSRAGPTMRRLKRRWQISSSTSRPFST